MRNGQTRRDIARDLKAPKWVVSRPVKKEDMRTIYKVANEASENLRAKALCNVQGAFYAHPRAPGASTEPTSNWRSIGNRGNANLSRLFR